MADDVQRVDARLPGKLHVTEKRSGCLYADRVEVERRVATARRERLEVVLGRSRQKKQVQQDALD